MDTRRLDRNNFELRPRVRSRLEEAREALGELAREQHEYLSAPEVPDEPLSFSKPKEREHRDIFALEPLNEAFAELEAALRAHLDDEETNVYPALRGFLRVGGSVDPLLDAQRRAHVDLLHVASSVRREIAAIPPMRKPMGALLQHLEKQIQYEETRIFPELMGEAVEDETPIPNRYRTSTDVARTLRRARPQEPEPEPDTSGFFSGLFKKWVKNR
ncbi:MAG: hemerythrin domain-containing protein [Alphaproteobacteria bacterium]|nr:hemerythrin domain-containing protein [Alphaproteobacteria bacterium]